MRFMKLAFVAVAATAFGSAQAFHSGGVAECEGCHSMHNPAAGGSFLLVGSTPSSTCLSCHENAADTGPSSYHISTAGTSITGQPLQRTPGGDFGWVKKSFTYLDDKGATVTESGDGHGHNINAPDKGYNTDATLAAAPGGTFPSAQLACNSCHDPHGQFRRLSNGTIAKTGAPTMASGSYNAAANEPTATEAVGVYRLLAGAGYQKDGITFNGVPAAKVPSSYNRTEATNSTRVAYGNASTGGHVSWGNWCGTCHPNMHSSTSSKTVHPVDQNLGSIISGIYASYVKSGDLTGSATSAYTSLVPFIQNTASYTTLASSATNGPSAGPASTDQVSCMSCHRAHASGWEYMLRFDYAYEFTTKAGEYVASDNPAVTGSRAGLQHRGRTIADAKAAYYDRPATVFASYQRVLCNKCHAKD